MLGCMGEPDDTDDPGRPFSAEERAALIRAVEKDPLLLLEGDWTREQLADIYREAGLSPEAAGYAADLELSKRRGPTDESARTRRRTLHSQVAGTNERPGVVIKA